MKMKRVIELLKQYGSCPCCGNHLIGDGEGALVVDDHTFTRTCKCGFRVTIPEGERRDAE